jgi:hypothetical protein
MMGQGGNEWRRCVNCQPMIGVWPAWGGERSYREPFLHSVRCGFTFFNIISGLTGSTGWGE